MKFPRASGVLMHPTSLPGPYGIGDLGKNAYKFVDALVSSKQTYWQVLPLGPTGFGDSPYQCFSAFAGNTNLISPDVLLEEGLIDEDDILEHPVFPADRVEYGDVIEFKHKLLAKAYQRFRLTTSVDLRGAFETFCQQVAFWLDEYALFRAIKTAQGEKLWLEWDETLKQREDTALHYARENLAEEIRAQKFYQFLFFKQWSRLKNYSNGKGIKIVGDIPIFVSLDCADVWSNPELFKLNDDCSPKVVAGVPPDYYSDTGQLWGNPIYDWNRMSADGFRWWVERVRFTLKTVDVVRVDHFRGFAASWEVPGKDLTAENGEWVNVPGQALFETLYRELGDLPVIAEDLGVITPDVEELRDGFDLPGMRILQFGFGGDPENADLPHNYTKDCVAYTGTHDNDTTVGWFNSRVGDSSTRKQEDINREQEFCLDYLKSQGEEIHWDCIRAVWSSVASTVISPMQDVCGLGNDARMNLPASESGNWQWRAINEDISEQNFERLLKLTELYGRAQK